MKRRIAYEMWVSLVDALVVARLGIGLDGLPDVPTMRWYLEGKTVERAANMAVNAARRF